MAVEDKPFITGVSLGDDHVAITYTRLPRDVRKNGLVWAHRIEVPFGSDYDDEIAAVSDALEELLADVLDDEDRAEPIDLDEEEEEEDEDEEVEE